MTTCKEVSIQQSQTALHMTRSFHSSAGACSAQSRKHFASQVACVAGFAQVAELYNLSNPDSFLGRVLDVADVPLMTSSSYRLSTPLAATLILNSFARSHVLPQPWDFYANQSVGAP